MARIPVCLNVLCERAGKPMERQRSEHVGIGTDFTTYRCRECDAEEEVLGY